MNTVSIREVKTYAGIARPDQRARLSVSEIKSALEKYAKPAECRGPYYKLRIARFGRGMGRTTRFIAYCEKGRQRYVIHGAKGMRLYARMKNSGADVSLINEVKI